MPASADPLRHKLHVWILCRFVTTKVLDMLCSHHEDNDELWGPKLTNDMSENTWLRAGLCWYATTKVLGVLCSYSEDNRDPWVPTLTTETLREEEIVWATPSEPSIFRKYSMLLILDSTPSDINTALTFWTRDKRNKREITVPTTLIRYEKSM